MVQQDKPVTTRNTVGSASLEGGAVAASEIAPDMDLFGDVRCGERMRTGGIHRMAVARARARLRQIITDKKGGTWHAAKN